MTDESSHVQWPTAWRFSGKDDLKEVFIRSGIWVFGG
jgi:hypothetical protein